MSSFGRSRRPVFGKWLLVAVAGVALGSAFGTHASAATVTWTNSAGGNFGSNFNWSTSHHPVAGDTGNITTVFGGADYVVTVTDDEAAAVINVAAANASLVPEAGGVLTVGTVNVSVGQLRVVSGATLTGATVALSGAGQFNVLDGILNQVTVTGGDIVLPVTNAGAITVMNGLNLSGHAIDANGNPNSTLVFDAVSQSLTNGTLNCAVAGGPTPSTIQVGGPTSTTAVTLTFDSNTVVHGMANIINNPGIAGDMLINNGVINEELPGSSDVISVDHFTNNGTLNIGELTMVSITSTQFTNHGRIQLTSGGKLSASHGLSVGNGTLAGTGTITGSVALQSTATPSTLHFDLGGTTQGTNYDSILVNGSVSLGGNLDIAFKNNFQNTIAATNTFVVMTLGAGQTFSGAFLNAPNGGRVSTSDGFGSFKVVYGSGANPNEIVLSNFAAPGGVPGDYNNNGVVDAADYVLWRNGGPLQNEVDTPGTVNAADYTAWRARFGNTSGAGAGQSTGNVPEPSVLVLALTGVLFIGARRR